MPCAPPTMMFGLFWAILLDASDRVGKASVVDTDILINIRAQVDDYLAAYSAVAVTTIIGTAALLTLLASS